jgi:pimeloyl-ACP methyl ester carboxylesterase
MTPVTRRWLERSTVYGISALGITLVTALLVGSLYQELENRRDLRSHPAPGRLVNIGGRRLHLWCTGEGSPTVVLEAGGGDSSLVWSRVQPVTAMTNRVCSYDRAGLGWSDLGPNPRTAEQIVAELHTLLHTAQVPGPYVLVAHSIGGLYVRLYASHYSNEVAGLVLVDTTHEDVQVRLPIAAGPVGARRFVVYLHSFLTVIGYARVVGYRFAGGPRLSPEARELARGIRVRTAWPFADGAETLAQEQSAAEVRQTRWLWDRPLVVIERGRWNGLRGLPPPEQDRIKTAWRDMQADLVRLSVQGVLIVADASDHYVHVEQPAIVIEAIKRVIAAHLHAHPPARVSEP